MHLQPPCTFSSHVPQLLCTFNCHVPQLPYTFSHYIPQPACTFSHSKQYLQISFLNHCTKWFLLNDASVVLSIGELCIPLSGMARCGKPRWRQEDGANRFWYSSSLVVSASLVGIWKLWNSFKTCPFMKLLKYILRLDHVSFTSEFWNEKVLTHKKVALQAQIEDIWTKIKVQTR